MTDFEDKMNQDRGCVVYPFRRTKSHSDSLFMVIDGHGVEGAEVSELVMDQVT
jgi:serine/threonine protein phosphatase PrpC